MPDLQPGKLLENIGIEAPQGTTTPSRSDDETLFDPHRAQRIAAAYTMATGKIVIGKYDTATQKTRLECEGKTLTRQEIRDVLSAYYETDDAGHEL